VTQARYQPYDLKSLTFKPIDSEQEVDVWHATPAQFHAFVSQFAEGFGKVNVSVWPLAERLAFVNAAWLHFQAIGRPFPFRERYHVESPSGTEVVPDGDVNSDTPASQAG
jgi:hypothetical protein